jgi:hypothetical protein
MKLKHWRGAPGKNSYNAAPVLEFAHRNTSADFLPAHGHSGKADIIATQ